MKRIAVVILIISFCLLCFAGCNKQILDFNYKFDYAIVNCFGEIVEGPIKSWNDYDDSDMVQVIFENGDVYYTHGSNVIFINK